MGLPIPAAFGGSTHTITTSATPFSEIVLNGAGVALTATVKSETGSSALTDFEVQIQGYSGGPWVAYLSGTDWSSSSIQVMQFCSTQKPNDLEATEVSMFSILINGAYAVRFSATAAATTASITIGGGIAGGMQ